MKNFDSGTNPYDQGNHACVGTENGPHQMCIHGGEKKKVPAYGYSSCTNLTITDSLGAFDWVCLVTGGTATFYSSGLKTGKGLHDLINPTGPSWNNNSVTIRESGTIRATSTSGAWWGNTVLALPTSVAPGGQTLSGYNVGTVFVLSSNASSSGININDDKYSIVVMPGSVLSYFYPGSNNCKSTNGEASPAPDRTCLIAAGSQKFLWIEGVFQGHNGGTKAHQGIFLHSTHFSVLKQVQISQVQYSNIWLFGSMSNLLDSVSADTNTSAAREGIELTSGSDNNSLYNIYVANHKADGLHFDSSSDGNTVQRLMSANNVDNGVEVGSMQNSLSEIVTMNNGWQGVFGPTGPENTYSHLTVANSVHEGILIQNASKATVSQVFAINNSNAGLYLSGGSGNHTFAQLVMAHNNSSSYQIYSTGSYPNYYTRNILFSGTTGTANCSIAGGATAGLDNSCLATGSSNSVLRDGLLSLAGSIFGKVDVGNGGTDSINSNNINGTYTFASILDWTHFETWFRGFGADGGVFPIGTNAALCSGGSCRIWDWRLDNLDTKILNRSDLGNTANGAFTAGSTCPSAVDGNYVIDDRMVRSYSVALNQVENYGDSNGDDDGICETGELCHNRFLANAVEIFGDSVGDDDGLCESNEACVYSPNFGAYQGESALSSSTCTFSNGTASGVQGISMYSYTTNGV